MTSQDYKDLAKANGYDLGVKTDEELLADYAFHKAACTGMDEELFIALKNGTDAAAGFHYAYRVRFMAALDGLDAGTTTADIWTEVCRSNLTKTDAHDAEGNLIVSKL